MKTIRFLIVLLFLMTPIVSAQFAEDMTLTQQQAAPASSSSSYPSVPFDTNKSFLIYTTANSDLVAAMNYYGLSYTTRSASQPVTLSDLNTHDILIVGWNTGNLATMDGLDPDIIEAGITGRIILTGHDADFHVVNSPDAGNEVFEQMIKYALDGFGTGMVAFGDHGSGFEWTPDSWEIIGYGGLAEENVEEITPEGVASGIYDNLVAKNPSAGEMSLSNWGQSFHNYFESWANGFEPFELGRSSGQDVITLGTPFNAYGVRFTKEDDVADGSCVSPETGDDNDITYTICWKNTTGETLTDVRIVDYLPNGVDYPDGWDTVDSNLNIIPGDPAYSQEDHTYTWEIGTVTPVTEDPNNPDANWDCVTLDVVVNENAIPGAILHNEAVIIGTYGIDFPDPNDPNSITTTYIEKTFAIATEDTPVCCWGNSSIIYVDKNATGANTGVTWNDAYNTEYGLQKALDRAWDSSCSGPFILYVAQGTYLPGMEESDSFYLLGEMEVYGGFPTGGCDFSDRNPKKYETILSGNLGDYAFAYSVVTMGYDSLLSGVTVKYGLDFNVNGDGSDFTLSNCIIENGLGHGVYSEFGDATIKSCLIRNNGSNGVYHESVGNNLNVSNSWVMRNNRFGIECVYTTPIVKNCIVSESDLAQEGYAGVSITNPASSPIIHNTTLSNNKSVALYFEDNGNDSYPDVQNAIIYYNNNNSKQQVTGFDPNTYIAYSCVQECVEVNNNINTNPQFAYTIDPLGSPDPTNYHLSYNSACIDSGNPNLYYDDQLDYDNETRVYGNEVDRGADEVYSCDGDFSEDDFRNAIDYNADGIINLEEFQPLADAWLTLDPNDPRWISDPNFADPNSIENWNKLANFDNTGDSQYSIDIDDLAMFCEDWLWKACWYDNLNSIEVTTTSTQSVTLLSTDSASTLSTKSMGMASLARTTSTLMATEDIAEDEYSLYDSLSNTELAQVVKDFKYLQDNVEDMLEQCPENSEDEENLLDLLIFFDDELAKIKDSLQ